MYTFGYTSTSDYTCVAVPSTSATNCVDAASGVVFNLATTKTGS